jgi:hypothetical protein
VTLQQFFSRPWYECENPCETEGEHILVCGFTYRIMDVIQGWIENDERAREGRKRKNVRDRVSREAWNRNVREIREIYGDDLEGAVEEFRRRRQMGLM